MKIDAVELRVLKMRLLKPFRTSFGVQQDRYPLLVRLEIDERSQWGECVAGERPWYSYEPLETAWQIPHRHLLPAAIARDPLTAHAPHTPPPPPPAPHTPTAATPPASPPP